tara:strand:- start:2864 stop:3274 length:411 start_codon:yes stop_codon:yes gene_type:complete
MKYLLIINILLFTGGCSTLNGILSKNTVPEVKPIEIITVEKPAPMYHPPLPENVYPAEIKWKVLNPEVMREYVNNYDNGDAPAMAYYGLTSQGYENLSNNMADIKRYIRQTLAIIKYYRDNDSTREDEDNGQQETN